MGCNLLTLGQITKKVTRHELQPLRTLCFNSIALFFREKQAQI